MGRYLLNIGDASVDGQVEIIDKDRLCYIVKNTYRNAIGIRTISKSILNEFVKYILDNPDSSANNVREVLSGQTQNDKYEYGYCSTLYTMAKMMIGQLPVNRKCSEINDYPHQTIFYGAPGTGKSHKIKQYLEGKGVPKKNVFRTTFHPDSDYASFVGVYKPTMSEVKEVPYTKQQLISKLTEMKNGGVKYVSHKFSAKYWQSLKGLEPNDKKDILQACGMSGNTPEFEKGIAIGEEFKIGQKETNIIYSFVPQVFLKAYIRAYQTTDPVYLVIEEINRGNCAQIFGDLFQLLDRNAHGSSDYSIKADEDIKLFLEQKLGVGADGIKDGELSLPDNLYIFATMNTSDQSLFPIDSAFKRRWDWEYEPIKYANTEWKIVIGVKEYSWTSFQRIVNAKIFEINSSEDKMLGDFFVNPANGIITEKVLLNKILFYLWNDVCKDGEGDIFKTANDKNVTFSELHGEGGTLKLIAMMEYLSVPETNNQA